MIINSCINEINCFVLQSDLRTKIITKMRIAKKIAKRAKNNPDIISKLVTHNKKSYPTIMRWFAKNDERLTQATSLKIICDGLGISQEEALEKEPVKN